jgi:hypothetical protein
MGHTGRQKTADREAFLRWPALPLVTLALAKDGLST